MIQGRLRCHRRQAESTSRALKTHITALQVSLGRFVWVLGFRFSVLGFRVLGFRVLGFRVEFRVWRFGFRVSRLRILGVKAKESAFGAAIRAASSACAA